MSCNFNFYSKYEFSIENPKTEKTPPKNPIRKAYPGYSVKSQLDPIMTPPASVAFKICSMSYLPLLSIGLKMKDAMQLAIMENVVLITIRCRTEPLVKTPLNDGQYIQRKSVPIIAIRLLVELDELF